nr:hypothetical protein CFP56_67623 [Quercus suber]
MHSEVPYPVAPPGVTVLPCTRTNRSGDEAASANHELLTPSRLSTFRDARASAIFPVIACGDTKLPKHFVIRAHSVNIQRCRCSGCQQK